MLLSLWYLHRQPHGSLCHCDCQWSEKIVTF